MANPAATGIRASGPVISGKKVAVSKVHYSHVTVTERSKISQTISCLHRISSNEMDETGAHYTE